MANDVLKSLADITKDLASTSAAMHEEGKADATMLMALYTTLLQRGVLSVDDLEAVSVAVQGDEALSDRIKTRFDIIKKHAKV
ncbi:hypothetical protein ACRRRS_14815 [Brucella anthropi]|uniref:Uncharacterized protein n=1 Tax=Brucella anthropi TaxID=529 RepID=A0A8I0NAI7_BRUAN|nr:hypothetical protein [Brucella anthropi]MBE0563590.1 hypothetical protein [Brucella anthropi]